MQRVARVTNIGAVIVLVIVLAACVADDDDDETPVVNEPTAISSDNDDGSDDPDPQVTEADDDDDADTNDPTSTTAIDPECDDGQFPTVAGESATINSDDVRLREGPGAACGILLTMNEGTEVQVLSAPVPDDEGNEWIKIEIATGEVGWVNTAFYELDSDAGPTETPEDDPLPDLAVSVVVLSPSEPVQSATRFKFEVFATNRGDAYTGDFSLLARVFQLEPSAIYPSGWNDHTGLDPGDSTSVYVSPEFPLNCSGPHEVRVEFTVPNGDADPSNNFFVQPFTVLPSPEFPPCT